jgi:peroxisomal enoyl-CoA hydratase 2
VILFCLHDSELARCEKIADSLSLPRQIPALRSSLDYSLAIEHSTNLEHFFPYLVSHLIIPPPTLNSLTHIATMSGPGVGFEYPRSAVAWLKRDVLLFAASIGCTVDELHFLYELHPNFAVFPTYSIILPFKRTTQEVIDFYAAQAAVDIPDIPKLDAKRVVDGQRKIEFLKPLPTSSEGKSFELRTKVLGVYDKGKPGTVVETEQLIVDKETGEVYSRAVGSGFFVGQGGWGGPKGPATENFPPPKGKKPDARHEMQLKLETPHLYR